MFRMNRIVLVLLIALIVSSFLSIVFQAYGLIWFSRNDYLLWRDHEWAAMDSLGRYEGNTLIYKVRNGIQVRPTAIALVASVVSFVLSVSYFGISWCEIRQNKRKITRTWAYTLLFMCALLTAGLTVAALVALQASARSIAFIAPDDSGYISVLEETSLDIWTCYLSRTDSLYILDLRMTGSGPSSRIAPEFCVICKVATAGRWVALPCTIFAILICASVAWNWWLSERKRQRDIGNKLEKPRVIDSRCMNATA